MDNQPAQQPDQNSNPPVQEPAVAQTAQPQVQPQPLPLVQTQTPEPTQTIAKPVAQPIVTETTSDNQNPETGWKFNGNDSSADTQTPLTQQPPTTGAPTEIEWSASEYVHHEKDAKWYFAYSGVSLLILVVVYLLTRDEISVGILAILAIGFGVFAARKPETLDYRIDASGVHVGPKLYPVTMFKSFAVVEEGSINSIALMPLKRFMPPITMYCAPEDEKKIEQALGAMLPQETKEQDRVDKLMHKVGF
jgi:hypothetical protein